jgi:hypothetical protein
MTPEQNLQLMKTLESKGLMADPYRCCRCVSVLRRVTT